MLPKAFQGANTVLYPPTNWDSVNHGNCAKLNIRRENGTCISCWHVSLKERISILFGAPVYLHVASGTTQPPVKLLTGWWEA